MPETRILGIDPGSRITGIGIIDSDGRQSRLVFAEGLRLGNAAFPERLGRIFTELQQLIQLYRPTQLAIENVFVHKSALSALKLGQARGAAICAAVTNGLEVHEYAPKSIKQAVVGSGGADKDQVQQMVKMLLNQHQTFQIDSSDALAVALCHAHTHLVLSAAQKRAQWGARK